MSSVKNVIILGSSYPSARPYIYELAKLDLTIYTADSNFQIINTLSVKVKKHFRLGENKNEWLKVLIKIANNLPNTMIIPTLPNFLYFCLEYKDLLSNYYLLACESLEIDSRLDNRISSSEIAKSVNLLVPNYYILQNRSEIDSLAKQLDFKQINYILKFNIPDIYLLKDQERCTIDAGYSIIEFTNKLKEINITETNPLIVQEYIPGSVDSLIGVSMICDHNSDPILIYSTRRVKEYPTTVNYTPIELKLGKTVCVEEYFDSEAIDFATKIAKQVKRNGLFFVEFKRSSLNNKLYFIKFQTRCKDVMTLSKKLNQNLYILQFKFYANLPISSEKYIYESRIWLWTLEYLKAIKYEKNNRLKFLNFFTFLNLLLFRKKIFAYFKWQDPLPILGSTIAKLTQAKHWYKYVLK
jgi:predicted ATP-grasp superfamily ATP-dependent carboligase